MIGQTIAHYTITAKLGEGGMGEVYLAVDAKLDRKVALKFLPRQTSSDPDAKARFLQEARAASALAHPNICTIYDLQETDGQLFIVMEYVEGQTLREHTQPFTIKQIVEIGIQMAEGLAAAHEKGIVHRDIKTENIMMRKDGIVQLMDFGLAKLRGATRLTKEGSTVGTVGYMSPEQVQGLETDHRTDLFSLGVVLYELLAGQLPFKGVHETAIMYEIVHVDPQPLSAIRDDIDPELDRLILDCLQKDPNDRCQSAREISRDLRRFKIDSGRKHHSHVSAIRPLPSAGHPSVAGGTAGAARGGFNRFKWPMISAAIAIIVTASAFLLVWQNRAGQPSPHAVRFTITAPPGTTANTLGGSSVALSPDGQRLVIVMADSSGTAHLWLRSLNALSAQCLPGTEGAYHPFWAPDSRWLGFFAGAKLKKIDVAGGPVFTLCDAPLGRGGTWNREGTIVFSPNSGGGLFQIDAAGGVPIELTQTDSLRYGTHRWPYFLPDNNRFLYMARTGNFPFSDSTVTLWVGALDGSVNRPLIPVSSNAAYADGHLFYLRERTLMAQSFDAGSLALTGTPTPLAEGVSLERSTSFADFSVADNGTYAYQTGEGSFGYYLMSFDRNGRILDTIAGPGQFQNCMLSPNGRFLAVSLASDASGSSDIWLYDVSRKVQTRLTFDPGPDVNPVWSADGGRVFFGSARNASKINLYQKRSSGAEQEQLLLTSDQHNTPLDCTSDGKYLLFTVYNPVTYSDDLWLLPLAEDATKAAADPVPFLQSRFWENDGRFSPDNNWVAYYSNEEAPGQVYVSPFPGPGGKWQISIEDGDYPRWRRDGKELFYIGEGGKLMAVEVNGTGSSFEAGRPHPLFQARAVIFGSTYSPFDATADGQTFYIITGDAGRTSTINVVLNWNAELSTR